MEILKTFILHSGGVSLMAIFVLMANLNLVHVLGEGTARVSHFKIIKTENNVNHTSVNRTYENTGSVLHCGMRCSDILAPSFYFMDQTLTCHCNNHHDPNVEEDTGPGSIKYGLLVKEETGTPGPRMGNYSECQVLLFYQGVRDDGLYNGSNREQVFCNLTALGWVVFQRRLDGSVDFNRSWTEYVNGFGDPNGEFWLGLETIHQLTIGGGCELNIYLEAEPNITVQDNGYARYSSFSVSNATDNYRLHVSGFSGNVGDSLARQDGFMFSTYDADNDVSPDDCVQLFGGAWWYEWCYDSNLNGAYLPGSQTYAHGLDWRYPWGFSYSLIRTQMAFRC